MMRISLKLMLVVFVFTSVHGFCDDRKLNGDLSRAALKASEWLREQMGENGTLLLGHATANAFHSLRLVGYSVPKVSKLGAEHLKKELNDTGLDEIPGGRLAYYILGVISSCENPRDFNKKDLVAALKGKMTSYGTVGGFNHPFQLGLALLAFCTSGEKVDIKDVRFLVQKLKLEDDSLHGISTLSIGIIALSCIRQKQKLNKLKRIVRRATRKLRIIQKAKKNSFGNEASTSLAVQALLAAGVKCRKWDCKTTMKQLLAMQSKYGAFKNVLGTMRAIPALIGAVHYDVMDLACPNKDKKIEERKNITVCMKVEFEKKLSNIQPPPAEYFVVPNGTTAHSIMKLASKRHPCYNFTAELQTWGNSIVSICGVSRDHHLKKYWWMLIDPGRKSASYGVDTLRPRDGQCLILRYRQLYWQ